MSMLHLLWIVPLVAGVAWGFGYKANPERVRAFVKAHIVDEDPYQDEGHSATRYAPEPGESPIAREARKAAEVGTQGDYIDWSKIPNKFDFVAADEDGKVYGFHFAPHLHYWGLPKWSADGKAGDWCDAHEDIVNDAIIGPLPTWRESLRKRPS